MCELATAQGSFSGYWWRESRRATTQKNKRIHANWNESGRDCMESPVETDQKRSSEGWWDRMVGR